MELGDEGDDEADGGDGVASDGDEEDGNEEAGSTSGRAWEETGAYRPRTIRVAAAR